MNFYAHFKKVQFSEAALFALKIKFNLFLKKNFEQSGPKRACEVKKNFQVFIQPLIHTLAKFTWSTYG